MLAMLLAATGLSRSLSRMLACRVFGIFSLAQSAWSWRASCEPGKRTSPYSSIFTFAKPANSGTVMHSLRGLKSKVANLESMLLTYEGGYILFRQAGLDLSAFEERTDVFPATWSGASRPLSLFEAPASASRQLALSWRSPLIHLK
ncbi:ANKRD50, partial [Symbiodinium microadriaticum]